MSSRTLTDFNASPCRDDVETGGGEEVAEERDVVEAEAQTGRSEIELGLIVRADQPEFPLHDLETGFSAKALELLRSHLGALDAQQLINLCGIFLEYSQVASVKAGRQEVHERNFGADTAPTYLLMATERHLPGRESEEHDSVGFQELLYAGEEGRFVIRLDVLDHIVDQHDVETVVPSGHIQKVSADELARHIPFGEIFLGIFYLVGSQIDARHAASRFGERQKISALAAANLQHPCSGSDVLELPEIVNVKLPGSLRQLPEIPFPVCVSLLHSVCLMSRKRPCGQAILKKLTKQRLPDHNINKK